VQCERPTALRWLTAWGFRLNLLYAVCMYVFYLCLICAAWSALKFFSVACMHTWTNVYRQYRAPTAKGQLRMPCTACSQFVCLRWDSTRLSSPILQMTALRFVCARTHAMSLRGDDLRRVTLFFVCRACLSRRFVGCMCHGTRRPCMCVMTCVSSERTGRFV
jgi:hypothetical protein